MKVAGPNSLPRNQNGKFFFLVQDMASTPTSQGADPSQVLLQFTTAYVSCAALWVAAELKVADLIGTGSRPVAELASRSSTNEDALFRILRLLSMGGIFTETESRHFSLTPQGELLRSDHPQSMRDTVMFLADPFHLNVAAELLHAQDNRQSSTLPASQCLNTSQAIGWNLIASTLP
ncbi:MAG: hypothetical protein JO270_20260 [Acidobacteriaceae bacterium]|nr:hypothetical protein [Acidobacteriaceae bacterium]